MTRLRVFVLLLSAAGAAVAADDTPVLKVYKLTRAPTDELVEHTKAMAGDDGTVVVEKAESKLLVVATPDRQEKIGEFVTAYDAQPVVAPEEDMRNVSVTVTIRSLAGKESSGAGIDGKGAIRISPDGTSAKVKARAHVNPVLKSREDSLVSQNLVVANGGTAELSVSEDVPYSDWLIEYGRKVGLIERDTTVKAAGSYLRIQPRILAGGLIGVRLTPQLRLTTPGKAGRLNFTSVSTEVTVANGATISLGGLARNSEFFSKFLVGYDASRSEEMLDITLSARAMDTGGTAPSP